MADVHQSSPVAQEDTVNDHDASPKPGGLRAKLKQKLFHSSRKDESGKPHKADSSQVSDAADGDGDAGAEVLGLIRTRSNSNEASSGRKQSPNLEKHISAIAESDDDDERETGRDLPPKLKRQISSVPVDDFDSEHEQPAPTPAKVRKQDSGVAGSSFEEDGILHVTTNEANTEAPLRAQNSPEVAEQISSIPKNDEARRNAPISKLERTISSIPADDYDSDAD